MVNWHVGKTSLPLDGTHTDIKHLVEIEKRTTKQSKCQIILGIIVKKSAI